MPHFATLKFFNATCGQSPATFCDIKKILMLRFETLKLFFNATFCDIKNRNFLIILRKYYNISFFYKYALKNNF